MFCFSKIRRTFIVAPGEDADKKQWQHRGYGEELLSRAEETARDAGYKKIALTSGIGVRVDEIVFIQKERGLRG